MILRELFGFGDKQAPVANQANPTPPVPPVLKGKPLPPVVKPNEPPPFNPAQHKNTLIDLAKKKGLKNANDLASFLGQCQVETANWTAAAEKFNYNDPVRIYKVFTSNFKSPDEAKQYINNPVALANRALANKNGNGSEESGDGWKYRGRGFIHITGRELYGQVGAAVHPENPGIYVSNPVLLSTDPKEAALASIAYFKMKVGKGKTAKQATQVVNPAGLKSKERVAATQQNKQQIAQANKKPGQAATPKPKQKPQPTKLASR